MLKSKNYAFDAIFKFLLKKKRLVCKNYFYKIKYFSVK